MRDYSTPASVGAAEKWAVSCMAFERSEWLAMADCVLLNSDFTADAVAADGIHLRFEGRPQGRAVVCKLGTSTARSVLSERSRVAKEEAEQWQRTRACAQIFVGVMKERGLTVCRSLWQCRAMSEQFRL